MVEVVKADQQAAAAPRQVEEAEEADLLADHPVDHPVADLVGDTEATMEVTTTAITGTPLSG